MKGKWSIMIVTTICKKIKNLSYLIILIFSYPLTLLKTLQKPYLSMKPWNNVSYKCWWLTNCFKAIQRTYIQVWEIYHLNLFVKMRYAIKLKMGLNLRCDMQLNLKPPWSQHYGAVTSTMNYELIYLAWVHNSVPVGFGPWWFQYGRWAITSPWEDLKNLLWISPCRLGLCGAAGGLRSVNEVCTGPEPSLGIPEIIRILPCYILDSRIRIFVMACRFIFTFFTSMFW